MASFHILLYVWLVGFVVAVVVFVNFCLVRKLNQNVKILPQVQVFAVYKSNMHTWSGVLPDV